MSEEKKLFKLKPDVIYDYFIFNNREIAVINTEYLGSTDKLVLGEIVNEGDNRVLKFLKGEDYKDAAKKYLELIDLFTGR